MRLAGDDITITVAGETVCLRPSLRVAMRLERRYGGFQALFRDIVDQKLSTYADVIGEFTTLPFLDAKIGVQGLKDFQSPLLAFVLAMTGHDDDAQDQDGPKLSYAEYHAKLYRIGTGGLGWTPETTWNATPLEITEAFAGRVDMLKAMFGASDKPDQIMSLDDKFKTAFRAMGAKPGKRNGHADQSS